MLTRTSGGEYRWHAGTPGGGLAWRYVPEARDLDVLEKLAADALVGHQQLHGPAVGPRPASSWRKRYATSATGVPAQRCVEHVTFERDVELEEALELSSRGPWPQTIVLEGVALAIFDAWLENRTHVFDVLVEALSRGRLVARDRTSRLPIADVTTQRDAIIALSDLEAWCISIGFKLKRDALPDEWLEAMEWLRNQFPAAPVRLSSVGPTTWRAGPGGCKLLDTAEVARCFDGLLGNDAAKWREKLGGGGWHQAHKDSKGDRGRSATWRILDLARAVRQQIHKKRMSTEEKRRQVRLLDARFRSDRALAALRLNWDYLQSEFGT